MGQPLSDTSELLRGVGADARESYYHISSTRHLLAVLAIILMLAISIVGLMRGGFTGYVLTFFGVFGLLMVGAWLCLR